MNERRHIRDINQCWKTVHVHRGHTRTPHKPDALKGNIMYYYGLFYCDEYMCPVTGHELLASSRRLKVGFAKKRHGANVYLWWAGVDAEAAAEHASA